MVSRSSLLAGSRRVMLAGAGIAVLAACSRVAEPPAADEAKPAPAGMAPATVAASASPVRPQAPDAATRAKLVGWWLRHDQKYMIVLDAVGESGAAEARYLNPQPIHVSKADMWLEGGTARLLLELTDEHYPGNFYELAYQPEQDIWVGVYHHLGNGQNFEVYFVRFEANEQ
jgi:hypothetical protein